MLKERAGFIKKANIVCDAALIVVSFVISFDLRVKLGALEELDYYAWVLLVAVPVWIYLLERFGFYASQRMSSFRKLLLSLFKVTAIGGMITSSFIFLLDPQGFSRGFYLTFLALSFVILAAEQLLVRFVLRLLRLEGYNYRNILLVGTGGSALRIVNLIENNKGWGLHLVGFVRTDAPPTTREVLGYPVMGDLSHLVEVCKAHPVDEVIFCDTREECKSQMAECIAELHLMGITTRTVLNLYYEFDCHKELGMLHDEVPLLTFHPICLDLNQLFYKRCLDIAGASLGLCFSAALFPFIAIALKLESPGPLFFGQTRVRENGRTFTCWKFRSMFLDAEERKKDLMHLNEMSGAIFKIKDDPRVTRVGAFLRKTSLDELPQFWNVLKGEMSLVGTRPPTPAEVHGYENWQRKRICMKPGITGLWQVSGRNRITNFDDVVRLDLEYIDSWSLMMDLRLILRTLKVVIFREGAC
ncbi:MAG: UDP-phosphate galactose phosphotransferase [Geobacteraceae bacterium GWC2_58_44]|nr:MAG: UDP-phosphate galactose phosphotransferase [Geobacteraceae bacterium GWC2_58_44]HBG05165.1 sugar transferase [Geobacter sp.]